MTNLSEKSKFTDVMRRLLRVKKQEIEQKDPKGSNLGQPRSGRKKK